MTNRFKSLDNHFPCGAERHSGEVVGMTVTISLHGRQVGEMYWKRKAWYVNSSVNAWHMHRGLCAEFRTDYSRFLRGDISLKTVNRILGDMVLISYMRNYVTDEQHHGYSLELESTRPMVIEMREQSYWSDTVTPAMATLLGLEADVRQVWANSVIAAVMLESDPDLAQRARKSYWKALTE